MVDEPPDAGAQERTEAPRTEHDAVALSDRPPVAARRRRWAAVARGVGEVCVTLGLILLLFVFYEVYVTNWFSAHDQAAAGKRLEQRWSAQRQPQSAPGQPPSLPAPQAPPAVGQGFARMYLPRLGPQAGHTVMQGTDARTLRSGPGHYVDTALPGRPGNFAVAGHRIGKGAPFDGLEQMSACDAVVVETGTDWFVYRMLPTRQQQANWDHLHGDPRCARVDPLGGQYAGVPGRKIVRPEQRDVIAPVPGRRSAPDAGPQHRVALLTLTTCHPRFSDSHRLIVHAVLTAQYRKNPQHPQLRPPELTERG